MNEGKPKFEGEKIELSKNLIIPEHPLSPLLAWRLKRWHKEAVEKFPEDIYQSSAEFLAKITEELEEKFGIIDYNNLTQEQLKYIGDRFNAHVYKFEKDNGISRFEHERRKANVEDENGDELSSDPLLTGGENSGNDEEKQKYLEWLADKMDQAHRIVMDNKDNTLGIDNETQWDIFKMFMEGNRMEQIVEKIKIDVPDKIEDKINRVIINVSNLIHLKATKRKGSFVLHTRKNDKTLELLKIENPAEEISIDPDWDKKRKIQFIAEFIGVTDESSYKRNKGQIYRLLDRAEKNGGKTHYFRNYHSNKNSQQK